MSQHHYITDSKGNKISVVIPIKEYNLLIEAREELKDIKAYDISKSKKLSFIEAATAFEEIEAYINKKKKS